MKKFLENVSIAYVSCDDRKNNDFLRTPHRLEQAFEDYLSHESGVRTRGRHSLIMLGNSTEKREDYIRFCSNNLETTERSFSLLLTLTRGGRNIYRWDLQRYDATEEVFKSAGSFNTDFMEHVLTNCIIGITTPQNFHEKLKAIYKEFYGQNFSIEKKDGFKEWSDLLHAEDGEYIPADSLG